MKNTIKLCVIAIMLLSFAACYPAKKSSPATDSTSTTTVKVDSTVKTTVVDTTKKDTLKKDSTKM